MGISQQVVTQQPTTADPLNPVTSFKFLTQLGWEAWLFVGLIGMMALSGGGHRKRQVASSRWGGNREMAAASRLGERQLRERKRNKITLYLGTPRNDLLSQILNHVGVPRTYMIPDAQEGIGVFGGPGKGKSRFVIDPMIRSALDQGFPVLLYDFKGEQIRRHAAYAASLGYRVDVFAPGFPYSGVINPHDFMTDSGDALMAKQLAHVFNLNSKSGGKYRKEDYFTEAGNLLVQTILMLAKDTIFPDLLMSWAILRTPDLAKRLLQAQKDNWIDIWADISATSLISAAAADQTSGGIVSTTVNTFAPMISREFIACLCGDSTISLEMTGKRLLVFQMDEQKRDVVAPLIASILHLVITKNMAQRRQEPLVLAMDEFPTLYLPDLYKWINEYREKGLVTILGFQNYAQLENTYGKEMARAIMGACATKFIFNPQESGTAQEYCTYFGEEEVVIKTRSRTHGRHSSHSHSEQFHKRPLVSTRDFLTLPSGKCIFVNPSYGSQGEAAIPLKFTVKIPKNDFTSQDRSEQLWDEKVRQRLVDRAQKTNVSLDVEQLKEGLLNRYDLADALFPTLPLMEDTGFGMPEQSPQVDLDESLFTQAASSEPF